MYENIFEMYQATPFALGAWLILVIFSFCTGLLVISGILTWFWNWCDDFKEDFPNPLLKFVQKTYENRPNPSDNVNIWYTKNEVKSSTDVRIKWAKERYSLHKLEYWEYYLISPQGKIEDNTDIYSNTDLSICHNIYSCYFGISFLISLIPFSVITILQFFTISLIIALFCAFVFGCRFIRRLQKKVCAHIENLEIHNKPKDEDKS